MRMGIVDCPDIVIAIGATSSNVVSSAVVYEDAMSIGIEAPATLPETVTIQISKDGTNFSVLNDGVANVLTPTAGLACVYPTFPWKYFKFVAGGAVAAARTFKMTKNVIGD